MNINHYIKNHGKNIGIVNLGYPLSEYAKEILTESGFNWQERHISEDIPQQLEGLGDVIDKAYDEMRQGKYDVINPLYLVIIPQTGMSLASMGVYHMLHGCEVLVMRQDDQSRQFIPHALIDLYHMREYRFGEAAGNDDYEPPKALCPCPFCGQDENLLIEQDIDQEISISCEDCGMSVRIPGNLQQALGHWNSRGS